MSGAGRPLRWPLHRSRLPCRPRHRPPFPRRRKRSARKRHQGNDRRRPAIHRNVQPARDAAERRHRREALPDRQRRRAPGRIDGRGSHILRQYAQKSSGAKEATVFGREPIVVSAAHAALANAASAHAMDYDDTQLSTTPDRTFGLLTHPTIPALSAALAVAERSGASGAAFLEAFLTGSRSSARSPKRSIPNHYERGLSQHRHARRVRRRGGGRQADEAERGAARAHAGDCLEPVRRHPRELRIDDQAAPRRARAARTACSPRRWPRRVSPAATTASTGSGDSSRSSAAAPISIG